MSMSYYEITLIFPAHSSIDWWDPWCHHIYYGHPPSCYWLKANSKYMFEMNYFVPSAWVYCSKHPVWWPINLSKMISGFGSSAPWSFIICMDSCRFANYTGRRIQSHLRLFHISVRLHHLSRRALCLSDGYHFPVTCTPNIHRLAIGVLEGKDDLTEDGRTIHI